MLKFDYFLWIKIPFNGPQMQKQFYINKSQGPLCLFYSYTLRVCLLLVDYMYINTIFTLVIIVTDMKCNVADNVVLANLISLNIFLHTQNILISSDFLHAKSFYWWSVALIYTSRKFKPVNYFSSIFLKIKNNLAVLFTSPNRQMCLST